MLAVKPQEVNALSDVVFVYDPNQKIPRTLDPS